MSAGGRVLRSLPVRQSQALPWVREKPEEGRKQRGPKKRDGTNSLRTDVEYISMTTTTNTNANANSTNGRVRKSLAEQIDRLDGILDGLADGLNEAVVTAVKGAVGAAVQEALRAVLTELLANPELLRQIHETLAPAAAVGAQPAQAVGSQPSQLRVQGTLQRCWGWIRACALGARRLLAYAANRGRHLAATACNRACLGGRLVRRLWRPLLIAISEGNESHGRETTAGRSDHYHHADEKRFLRRVRPLCTG
jgi:hypothetical protein